MNAPIPEGNLEGIRQALFGGRKIEAIKLYRHATNCGLVEAKNAVEKLEAELHASSPEKFTVAPSGKGCLAVMAMVCAIAALAILFFNHH